jgi:hypothetical protein
LYFCIFLCGNPKIDSTTFHINFLASLRKNRSTSFLTILFYSLFLAYIDPELKIHGSPTSYCLRSLNYWLTFYLWFFPDAWENSALVFNKNENGGFSFVMFQFKNARFEVWTLGRILFVALTSNSCL